MEKAEKYLRRLAARQGYRIAKSQGGYTLFNERLNTIMYYYADVDLDTIETFFSEAA